MANCKSAALDLSEILCFELFNYVFLSLFVTGGFSQSQSHIGLTFQKLRKRHNGSKHKQQFYIGQLLHTFEGLSLIQSTLINCLYELRPKHFSMFVQFKCVQAVLKGVVLTLTLIEVQLCQPMLDKFHVAGNG